MQIISPSQSRAARALLNWSQPELAERCGIHVQTISNFEKESSTPSKKTLEKISTVLQRAGIAFLDEDGVKRSQTTIQQYSGADGFRSFMDDVYETSKKFGGEVCLLNANPDLWIKWLGEDWYYSRHVPRMEKLLDNLNMRITIEEKNYNFIGRRFGEYRWLPKTIWNENSFYSYGDKIGFMSFENDGVEIFVLQERKFAETFRFLFNLVWNQYSIVPDTPDHKPQRKRAISQKD